MELRQLAGRIQARAVRRMGELLKQFDGAIKAKRTAQSNVESGLKAKGK
jgi:hypothetical protein